MQAARRADSEGFLNDMQWVKAHQSISALVGVASVDTLRKAKGNDFADCKAKEGLLLHPQPEHVDKVVCDRMVKHARQVCFLAAKVLPLWPSMQRTEGASKGPSTREVRKKRRRPHQWEPAVGRWHCGVCLKLHHGNALTDRLQKEECKGRADVLCDPFASLGHLLNEATSEGEPVVWCQRCGHWTSNRIRNLGSSCNRTATQEGRVSLNRISRGEHPKFSLVKRLMDGGGAALNQDEDAALMLSRHAATVRRLADRQERSFGAAWAEIPALPRGPAGVTDDQDGYPDGYEEDFYDTAADQAAIDAMFQDDPFGHGFFTEASDPSEGPRDVPTGRSGADVVPAPTAADLSEAQRDKVRLSKAKAVETRRIRKAAEAAKKAEADVKKAQRIMKIPRGKRTMAQKNFTFELLGDEALELPSSDVEGNSSEEERRERLKSYRAKQASLPTPTPNYSGASSSSAPAPPVIPATPTRPSSSTGEATTAKAPEQPPPRRLNAKTAPPATVAPAGLFGFVAKALGIPPELNLPSARASSCKEPAQSNLVEVESDSSESSPRGPGSVPEEWESSFQAFAAAAAAAATAAAAEPAAQLQHSSLLVAEVPHAAASPAADPAPGVTSDVATPVLRDLVDLAEVGEPVLWPPGLDVQVARLVLRSRSATRPEVARVLQPRVDAKPQGQATTAAERMAALRARLNLPTAPTNDQPAPRAASAKAKGRKSRLAGSVSGSRGS